MTDDCAHCWHTHEALLSDPPQYPQTCCRCGAHRVRKSLGEGLREHHGPFMPSAPGVSAAEALQLMGGTPCRNISTVEKKERP